MDHQPPFWLREQRLLYPACQGPSASSPGHLWTLGCCGPSPLSLQIPYSEQSYWKPYKLLVNGYVGKDVVFNDSAYLHFNPKSLSTLIQTDKPNYMPGQVVKIRAVSIHPDGRPYVNPIDIFIKVSVYFPLFFQKVRITYGNMTCLLNVAWDIVIATAIPSFLFPVSSLWGRIQSGTWSSSGCLWTLFWVSCLKSFSCQRILHSAYGPL